MGQIGTPLVGSYDLRLVALAFPSAILASHVALDVLVPRNGPRMSFWLFLLRIGVIPVFLLVTAAIRIRFRQLSQTRI
jgi:hypothetical protein